MAIKRTDLIDTDNAGFYHLISRCVRRALLCGVDDDSGKDYEHRREWIESRILELAEIFAIEVFQSINDNDYLLNNKRGSWHQTVH